MISLDGSFCASIWRGLLEGSEPFQQIWVVSQLQLPNGNMEADSRRFDCTFVFEEWLIGRAKLQGCGGEATYLM